MADDSVWLKAVVGTPWPDISHVKALPPDEPKAEMKCVRCGHDLVLGTRCDRCGADQAKYIRPERTR